MKPLTYYDRMIIARVLFYNAAKRAAFEKNVKAAKKLLGEDKIKIISNHPKKRRKTNEKHIDFNQTRMGLQNPKR